MQNPFGKKKTILEYFDEEYRYLDEAGREFAQAYPQRGRFLNIDQRDDRDPYVERLFEGFAFLTGRIRQKLDDELPELTQSLLGLLWPHFVRPIPSMSILEFKMSPGRAQKPLIIKRGTEVASQPLNGKICQFQSCYDLLVRPIILKKAVLAGDSTISFQFSITDDMDYRKLFVPSDEKYEYNRHLRKSLRLFIHDVDQPTMSDIHLYLTRYVQRVVIKSIPDGAQTTIQGQAGVMPVGFAPQESLLPYTNYSFFGYGLLQEYFCYPRKFMFFDIVGFDRLSSLLESTNELEVQVHFNRPFPMERRFSADNFRLHCVPIVNLFKTEALPIIVKHEVSEYRINPPEACEFYSVDSVEGVINSTMNTRNYAPFYSFKHNITREDPSSDRYYHVMTRQGTRKDGEEKPENYQDAYITIASPDLELEELREETLSIRLTCTNGRLSRELKEGDIRNRTSNSSIPEFIQFRNIIQPSVIIYPPLQSGLEWRFISHLALNYISLSNPESLRGLLELYNWIIERGLKEANYRRISSIQDISIIPREIPYRGSVIRGMEIILELLKENFTDDGDLNLFGMVMDNFFKMYASINSFIQLTVVSHETKEVLFKWSPEPMTQRNRKSMIGRKSLPL
ncbi:type VI secretion system baseplate subunit TssF [Candidatus Poribacteria bacterium]|nr:type VI secretion system baseplate subunit TssF [Candidatus Poribacteria bacterium]